MKLKSQSGGLLIATISFIIILSVGAAAVLSLTSTSYRLSIRNEVRAQARAVADAEMEALYYQFMTQVLLATPPTTTPQALAALGLVDVGDTPIAENVRDPFLSTYRAPDKWVVRRSAIYNDAFDRFFGVVPGTTKQGTVSSITVKIEVQPPVGNFFHDTVVVRLGRRFSTFNTPIFQYSVFYEGDLELAPGANMRIEGDISANGNVYLASTRAPDGTLATLTLTQKVRYLPPGVFNEDGHGNVVYRKPSTPVGSEVLAPTFTGSQATQVEPLDESENLQGGVDADELKARRGDLFPTVNDVYRSLIAPPPGSDNPNETPATYKPELGDDPTISAQRIYNRAGLRVTIAATGAPTIERIDSATGAVTDVTSTYAAAITDVRAAVTDKRENKTVSLTTIDVSVLKSIINPGGVKSSTFNGVLYVNVKNSTATNPGAVRLINAESTPETAQDTGFSVATNGGLYVKGNYNTTLASTGSTNPAMLMGDSVTLLSKDWKDEDSAKDMYDHATSTLNGTRRADATVGADGAKRVTIEAGILTGNVPADATAPSGGAQNLVRYLEDWKTNSITVLMHGAVGRLFQSKFYTAKFKQPGIIDEVYRQPAVRDIKFNANLLSQPPAGAPTTTSFSRGNFFMW